MTGLSVVSALPLDPSWILILSSLTLFFVYQFKRKYSYWERLGVPFVKSALFSRQRAPLAFASQRIYNELDGHKFGGFYQQSRPTLMLRDPALINAILVKNFSYFHDRGFHFDEKLDPLTANLLNLPGQRWKNVRYKLTPTFSSGKLRLMQDLMKGCIEELGSYLTKVTEGDTATGSEQNLRELMAKFTTDVIGACAFGFRCNSIKDENSEFRRIGRQLLTPSFRHYIQYILLMINPRLASIFRVKKHDPEVEEFFMTVIKEAVKHRLAAGQKRNDFLQLLINIQAEEQKQSLNNGHQQQNGINGDHERKVSEESARKSADILFTNNMVAANAFSFFVGGFETSASTLSYCLYELALNPDICEKLRDEVESVKQSLNGEMDYDALKKLTYMDAVVSETLRKYPTFPVLFRRCNTTFQIPGTSIMIEKGVDVHVSIYALHHDSRYFPEPEKFDPERFSEENKQLIKPGSYMPFGDGPRICIGMRFALFEIKSVLSYLVSNFTVHPCEKTVIPLKFDSRPPLTHSPLGGVWVRFQRRKHL